MRRSLPKPSNGTDCVGSGFGAYGKSIVRLSSPQVGKTSSDCSRNADGDEDPFPQERLDRSLLSFLEEDGYQRRKGLSSNRRNVMPACLQHDPFCYQPNSKKADR